MNPYDPDHRRIWDLLPWLANDSLTEQDRHEVETHLAICADCREELSFQRQVQAGVQADPAPVPDPAPGLARVLARIDALELEAEEPPRASAIMVRHRRLVRWLAAAVVVQSLGLGVLGAVLLDRNGDDARFATLSNAELGVATARIRLVPSPTLALAELQAVLATSNLRIVDSNPGGTILALDFADGHGGDDRVDQALALLRRERGVLLAEPILHPESRP